MSQEYDLYLQEHIANVKKAFEWLQWNMPQLFENHQDTDWRNIEDHDNSKTNTDEYRAYDAYFYGNKSAQVVKDFKKAWLIHIHRNPHHWQHWVLNCDEPNEGEVCVEMPYEYIIEMICDWWSFSFATGDLSEIFDWYDEHGKYIKLAKQTRRIVEDILWDLRDRLGYNVLAHHGIKGQKWGVRNGPPYPLENSQKSSTIVADANRKHNTNAKSSNYDVLDPASGEYFHFAEGSRIRNPQVFAGYLGRKPLDPGVADGLAEQIGGLPERWQHCKGTGTIDYYGEEIDAEVHWFQEQSVGKHKFKIKKWEE